MSIHASGYVDPDHAAWYQVAPDDVREAHLRAAHWPTWRERPAIMSAQDHADDHAARNGGAS